MAEIPRKAELVLAVAGWVEVSVNGQRVGRDVLSPVTCQPDARLAFITMDVTDYLKTGENVLEVLLGNGWFNCFTKEVWGFSTAKWLASPMIRGRLDVEGKTLVVTDGKWIAYDSPIVFNALRNGEWYDARKEGLRENERPVAVVAPSSEVKVFTEDAVPCREFDSIDPVRSIGALNGGTIYDFGSNRTGWCDIEVEGERGAKVIIDYDECITQTNTLLGGIAVFIKRANDPRPMQHDEYTLAGRKGGERWHPRFTYHGFRYAQVRTIGKVEIKSIRSVFVHSDFKSIGKIDISDPVFAKLQDAARRSYLSNFTGIPTDCPHREKNGWTGDAQLAMETGLWNFDAKDGYVHFLRMMLDAQKPNGQVPCILPCTEKFGYGWGSGPAWDAALFEIPWQIYRFYGDDAPAKEAYAAMKKYLGFISTKARSDGLIAHGLGDWCAPKGLETAPVLLTDSAYIYEFNRRTAFWAEHLGEKEVARIYHEQADRIKVAFNKEFYKGSGIYADGQLTALAAPLYFKGLCADGEEKKVAAELLRRVREDGHRAHFGILGAKWVPRVLSEYGCIDDAWRIFTQSEAPGWARWMENNDTLLESFDDDAGGIGVSHNHVMFGDFSAWAFEYLAGIKNSSPGFAEVEVKPHLPTGVDSFEIMFKAPTGPICVKASRKSGKPVYEVANDAKTALAQLSEKGGRIFRDIQASDEGGCLLDLYVPSNVSNFPVIVWFHGGGLTSGGKTFLPFKNKDIAQVAAGYRLLGGKAKTGVDCIEDAAAAVAWTLKNISQYGGDAKKVFVSGNSAGGYLTMMVGMDPKYLAAYGVKHTDLAAIVPITGQATKHFNVRKFGGDTDPQFLPKIDELAPLAHVSANIPPIYSICGQPPYEWKCRSEENRLLIASCVALGHKKARFIELDFCNHGQAFVAGLPYLEMIVSGRFE